MPSLIFSKAACLRILPFATKIECIRVYRNTIQVTYLTRNGRCSTFLSKAAFFQDFVAYRYEGAKSVGVRRWTAGTYECRYDCKSPNGENTRTVDLSGGTCSCTCPDYSEQYRILGKGRVGCKHMIAVLHHLGYGSLAEYWDAREREKQAFLAAKEEEARRSLFAS
jgi:hypothetical protein